MIRKKIVVVSLVVVVGIAAASVFVLTRPMSETSSLLLLESEDEEERRLAIERLGHLRSVRAIPRLISMMRAESEEPLRLGPVGSALARIGPPAVSHLVEAARDPDTFVGLTAASVLAEIGPSALPGLFDALDRRDESIRLFAKVAFSRMGPPVVPSVEALGHPDHFVRAAVIHLLAMQGDQVAGVIPRLIEALQDEHAVVRAAAAEALGVIDAEGQGVVPALMSVGRDERPVVRAAVAEALGSTSSAETVPAMVDALVDRDADVRLAAIESMARLSRKSAAQPALPALPVLVSRLGDPDARVRKAAASAVSEFGLSTRAVVSLLEEFLAREPSDDVGEAAIRALNRINEASDSPRRPR